ncbi:putative hemerythrin hhe cation binding domain-containing protein [Phaeomoniella chlamydospora]|uniref:Putative hemerythrin hhe cation binding domain-containing protein n=1 Tax=Phaeomoniella chlamydospora TaxID=158046 RepID=A0A0G2EEC1_PHACM|nr:putative hemerythrin hhe cation binding domain-containing protein [Phaeomoniella chlamydospora]
MASSSTLPFTLITNTNIDAWTDIPPNHPCITLAQKMAEVHNTFIRLCNASYIQAPQIKPGTADASDFLTWNKYIVDMIHEHHDSEEEEMFPLLENLVGTPGILSGNVDQHQAFHDALEKFESYCKNTKADDYSSEKVRQLWEELAPALNKHLMDEPETFYRLKDTDPKELQKLLDQFNKAAEKKTDLFTFGVLFLQAQDNEFPGVNGKTQILFADMPGFARYMIHYGTAWRYNRLWKFNPSDTFGNMKAGFV